MNQSLKLSVYIKACFILWLLAIAYIASCQMYDFGPVIVDGFQSAGAYADSQRPFDLHWPFMNGFDGFDQEWGFHWPGWPAVRSVFAVIMPWSARGEIFIMCMIWAVVVGVVGIQSAKLLGRPWLMFPIALGLMTGHRFLIGALSYRPEVFGALLFLGFACSISREWAGRSSKPQRGLLLLCSFLLPLVVPEGVAVPIGFFVFWVIFKRFGKGRNCLIYQRNMMVGSFLAYVAGVTCLAFHFYLQDHTLSHLQHNLEAQEEIPKGLWNTIRLALLSRAGIGGAPLFWSSCVGAGPALVFCVRRAARESFSNHPSRALLVVSSLMILGLLGVTLLTNNVNGLRLMMVTPWCVLWIASVWCELEGRGAPLVKKLSGTPLLGAFFAVLFAAPSLFFFVRCLRWPDLEGKALRQHAVDLVESLPEARMTYIPVGLWEAAVRDPRQRAFRFATFPNLALKERRQAYEELAYEDLQSGDLLVFDVTDDEGGGPFPNAENAKMCILSEEVRDESKWLLIDEVEYEFGDSKAMQRHWKVYQRK